VARRRQLAETLRAAKLSQNVCVEDFDSAAVRGGDRKTLAALATCDWVRKKQNVIIFGATGVGKTFLGCALSQKALREGFSALYLRALRMFEELAIAKSRRRLRRPTY
jgi:DNA replication protein DnaC